MSEDVNVKAKLGVDTIKVDTKKHITVNNRICGECKEKNCLHVCPAQVYKLNDEGEIVLDLEGCLECGTCVIACERGAIDWNYPAGGFGIQLRFG